jgi:hypothetical protein
MNWIAIFTILISMAFVFASPGFEEIPEVGLLPALHSRFDEVLMKVSLQCG